MSYKIGKGQYAGKGERNYQINIFDDNHKIVDSFVFYGSHKRAKSLAQRKVKELENKE